MGVGREHGFRIVSEPRVGANEEAQLVGVKSIGESEADTPDLEEMSNEELRAYSEAAIAGIDTKGHLPIRIASFPC